MKFARITTPGLVGMGITVAVLWGCLIGERVIIRRVSLEQTQALATIQALRGGSFERIRARGGSSPLRSFARPQCTV